jgi:hypothetical protein
MLEKKDRNRHLLKFKITSFLSSNLDEKYSVNKLTIKMHNPSKNPSMNHDGEGFSGKLPAKPKSMAPINKQIVVPI